MLVLPEFRHTLAPSRAVAGPVTVALSASRTTGEYTRVMHVHSVRSFCTTQQARAKQRRCCTNMQDLQAPAHRMEVSGLAGC